MSGTTVSDAKTVYSDVNPDGTPNNAVVHINHRTQPAPADATGTNGGQQGGDDKTFSKAEMEAIVKDRLERDRRKRDEADAKAKADATDEALKAQQQFKELADKRAERIVELEAKAAAIETLQQERDRLANVVEELVKQQREGLPEYVIELLDGKDVVDQLAWITKNRETLTGAANGGLTSGIRATKPYTGTIPREQLIAQEVEAQRARRR